MVLLVYAYITAVVGLDVFLCWETEESQVIHLRRNALTNPVSSALPASVLSGLFNPPPCPSSASCHLSHDLSSPAVFPYLLYFAPTFLFFTISSVSILFHYFFSSLFFLVSSIIPFPALFVLFSFSSILLLSYFLCPFFIHSFLSSHLSFLSYSSIVSSPFPIFLMSSPPPLHLQPTQCINLLFFPLRVAAPSSGWPSSVRGRRRRRS